MDTSVLIYDPPDAPILTPDEAEAAIRAGGVRGVLKAILDRSGLDPQARSGVVRHAAHAEVIVEAGRLLDQYRTGSGGPDLGDLLGRLERLSLAADVAKEAVDIVGTWMASNPGRLVHDPTHSAGRKRVFTPQGPPAVALAARAAAAVTEPWNVPPHPLDESGPAPR